MWECPKHSQKDNPHKAPAMNLQSYPTQPPVPSSLGNKVQSEVPRPSRASEVQGLSGVAGLGGQRISSRITRIASWEREA